MTDYTHWKKSFHPEYIGAHAFQPGERKVVTITGIRYDIPITGTGGKVDHKTVIDLDREQPMVLNRTNAKSITRALKTPYMEQWIGRRIELYVQAGIKAFGETVDAVRVAPVEPTALPPIGPEQFNQMCQAIFSGQYTKAAAAASFTLTPEQQAMLAQLPGS